MKNGYFFKIVMVLFFLINIRSFAQEKKIIKILNRELTKEIIAQKIHMDRYYGENFEVLKNFSIKNNRLSLEVKRKSDNGTGVYTEKQEVDLYKIKQIVKDINIILETEPHAVTLTNTKENGEKSVRTTDMFFLHLSYEKQNEFLADDIVEAFQKAGYKLKKGFWHD